jgi:hypothetical protein
VIDPELAVHALVFTIAMIIMIVARTGVHISEQTATTIAACEAAAVFLVCLILKNRR